MSLAPDGDGIEVHCWEDGPRKLLGDFQTGLSEVGSTCMLADGHDGDHEWFPDGPGWDEGEEIRHGGDCVCWACLTGTAP